jgi:hypothetical protein
MRVRGDRGRRPGRCRRRPGCGPCTPWRPGSSRPTRRAGRSSPRGAAAGPWGTWSPAGSPRSRNGVDMAGWFPALAGRREPSATTPPCSTARWWPSAPRAGPASRPPAAPGRPGPADAAAPPSPTWPSISCGWTAGCWRAWRWPATPGGRWPSFPGEGAALLAATRAQGLEGVVAKRLHSPYLPGRRTRSWRKVKHYQRETFQVGGYVPDATRPAPCWSAWPTRVGPAAPPCLQRPQPIL